jgi:hypothetical protein
MRYLFLFCFWVVFAGFASGQKFLQLERTNSPKTRKYYPGDEITFQLNNNQWYTRVIDDVSYQKKLILFSNGHVSVDSIVALRSFERRKWSKPLGNQLYNFAIAWTAFALIADAVSDDAADDYAVSSAVVAGSSVASGFLLKKLFHRRTFHFNKNKAGEAKKWRLRVLDLEVKPGGT